MPLFFEKPDTTPRQFSIRIAAVPPTPRLPRYAAPRDGALVTLDMGFANIRAYRPSDYPGLVVLRLRSHEKSAVIAAVRRVLPNLAAEPLQGRLWVVQEDRLRVRS